VDLREDAREARTESGKRKDGKGEGGLRHVLEQAYRSLGNPIAVIDTSYHLLEYTENTVEDDPIWNELIAGKSFSHSTVDFFNEEQFIQAVADADPVSLLKSSRLKYDRACGKFFDRDGIQLGSISVVACYRPFEPGDFEKMEGVCERISEEIQRETGCRITERVFPADFIGDLLEGNVTDRDGAERKIRELYAGLKSHLYVAVADISRYDPTISHLAYLQDVFAVLQKEYKYFIYLNSILILMSTDAGMLSAKKELGGLIGYCGARGIFLGVSGSFQNLFKLQKYYRQALDALNYGLSRSAGQVCFTYDVFKTDCFLNSIKDTRDLRELCHPALPLMQEFDRHHATPYVDTLRSFLMTGKSLPLTCARLGLEPQALRGRLEEMEKLFEIDWDDGNLLFSLAASYKILDCF
jgi:hypothetical protein